MLRAPANGAEMAANTRCTDRSVLAEAGLCVLLYVVAHQLCMRVCVCVFALFAALSPLTSRLDRNPALPVLK